MLFPEANEEHRVVTTTEVGDTFEAALAGLQEKQNEVFKEYQGCDVDVKEMQIVNENGRVRIIQQLVFSGNLPKVYTKEELTTKRNFYTEIGTAVLLQSDLKYDDFEGDVLGKLQERISFFKKTIGDDFVFEVSGKPNTYYDKEYRIWYASVSISCTCTRYQFDWLQASIQSLKNVEDLGIKARKESFDIKRLRIMEHNIRHFDVNNHGIIPKDEKQDLQARLLRIAERLRQ